MWNGSTNFWQRTVLLFLLVFCCLYSSAGYTKTATEMTDSITIPMQQWVELKNECQLLNNELIQCQTDLKKLKKPSAELLSQLETAEKMLLQLQTELQEQKADLMLLSKEAAESKTLLATLKQQISKERKIHKRQVWQNRFWCLLIGTGIGIAASR